MDQPPLLKCLDYLNTTLPEITSAGIRQLPENSLSDTLSEEKNSPSLEK